MKAASPASFPAAVLLLFIGCGAGEEDSTRLRITTGDSLLLSAARDALEGVPGIHFEVAVRPGRCPGETDLSPKQLYQAQQCNLFIRRDFQSYMDSVLFVNRSAPSLIMEVTASDGLLIPDGYIATAAGVARRAAPLLPPEDRVRIQSNVPSMRLRMVRTLETLDLDAVRSRIRGNPVIAADEQAAFCEWLGFHVSDRIGPVESLSAKRFSLLVEAGKDAGVRAVIGNLQTSAAAAAQLADQIQVPAIVLSNFPELTPNQPDYPGLLRDNLAQIAARFAGSPNGDGPNHGGSR